MSYRFFPPGISFYFCQMTGKRFFWVLWFAAAVLLVSRSAAQQKNGMSPSQRWADSIYNQLTPVERIGQLFMVAAYSGGKNYNEPAVRNLVTQYHIGGLIFMQNDPENQARLTNSYQGMSKVPLLIAMDAEWGLGMRLTGVRDFPRQMMLGAADDSLLAYELGKAVAGQCKRLGVHINFAPVVDVNNNPDNPVINARSFGENKFLVSRLAIAYMQGMQDQGIIACAKHFPGHGDTDVDSHKDLPFIGKSRKQLDTLEFYPFKRLIRAGVKGVMIAHLEVPAMEDTKTLPTSLSHTAVQKILKDTLGFKGLVFTDALNMKGVTKYYKPGEADLRAFMAGNDVLLFPEDVPAAIEKIREAVQKGDVSGEMLEAAVKKILMAKYNAGLYQYRPVAVNNVAADLNRAVDRIREAAAVAAISRVRDQHDLLSRMSLSDARITYVGVNAAQKPGTVLFRRLQDQQTVLRSEWLPAGSSAAFRQKLIQGLTTSDVAIVAVHNMKFYPSGGNYGLDAQQMAFLKECAQKKNVLFVLMGNPYLTRNFCKAGSVLIGYEDDSTTQHFMAEVILGKRVAKGKVPVTICPGEYTEPVEKKDAVVLDPQPRPGTFLLKKTEFVEDAGVKNVKPLDELSLFMQRSIVAGAFPGCRILAAKDGKVFYDESFGYLDYGKKEKVSPNTIYDLASVTKIVATTLAVMKLWEQKKLELDKTVGDYLPAFRNTDKSAITVRNLLLHQAGLKSWIPFYKETLDGTGNMKEELYATKRSAEFPLQVADRIFLKGSYKDTLWERIRKSPVENKGRYVYSDLDFLLLEAIVEKISGERIDKYVEEQFYKPLGLKYTAYQPLSFFPRAQIAPTEQDVQYRNQLIHGYVHDPAAAMLGGVAGHAGVFSTAGDVAVIMQMLLNGGSYNGRNYFKKETVTYFTRYHSRISRRGLGFDKASASRDDGGPAGNRVSGYAFGHQGFTGTCAWADPATGILFIFLSNRINPSADNSNINRLSVRTVAQDYIYESLGIGINKSRNDLYKKQVGL